MCIFHHRLSVCLASCPRELRDFGRPLWAKLGTLLESRKLGEVLPFDCAGVALSLRHEQRFHDPGHTWDLEGTGHLPDHEAMHDVYELVVDSRVPIRAFAEWARLTSVWVTSSRAKDDYGG